MLRRLRPQERAEVLRIFLSLPISLPEGEEWRRWMTGVMQEIDRLLRGGRVAVSDDPKEAELERNIRDAILAGQGYESAAVVLDRHRRLTNPDLFTITNPNPDAGGNET